MNLLQAKELAIDLMTKHLSDDWTFKFDNARRRFGVCRWGKKEIGLSKHLVELNSYSRVEQTILHEIAHALTPFHHHDRVWLAKARSIGYTGERCYTEENTKTPESKYVAECPKCGHIHKMQRTAKRKRSCGYCSSGYNPNTVLEYKLNPNY